MILTVELMITVQQSKCVHIFYPSFIRYLAHGTTTDYMYDIAKVPMPFTFEVSQSIVYNFQTSCLDNSTELTLLLFRYMEMRKHLPMTASKCSILLTRKHSTYVNLALLYLRIFPFGGVLSA